MNELHSLDSKNVSNRDTAETHGHHVNNINHAVIEGDHTRTFIQKKSPARISLITSMLMVCGLANAGPPTEFEIATIAVEQNATDGDTEVVMEALGGDEGLRRLLIRTPDKRLVVLVSSSDPTVTGIREFAFESPEPEGSAILAAYPEGTYTFLGISVTGERFKSTAELSHLLPNPTVITNPTQDATAGTEALTIEWSTVPNVAEYVIEFENESVDPEQVLRVNVPANSTSFQVPTSLLIPGSDYQVGVATVGENENVVVVENTLSTANQ